MSTETVATLLILAVLSWFLYRTRKGVRSGHHAHEHGVRILTQEERLDIYKSKFDGKDEAHVRRLAHAIPVQLKIVARSNERQPIPHCRALVVVPQAKSNVVTLPTGAPVAVEWRRPKLRMISR